MNTREGQGNFVQICFKCEKYKKSFLCLTIWRMDSNGNYILDTKGERIIGYMCLNCAQILKRQKEDKCLYCDTIDEGVCQKCKDRYYVRRF